MARVTAAKDPRPTHRALPDAIGEHKAWLGVRQAACALVLDLA
ncbi:hypothetical protein [Sphingomonas bacterium]|nr:hypothetical protein [Sphingomonas bacterium]